MNGLILAGGRSTRMGTDKSLLQYHNKPQWAYLYELLKQFCDEVFLSCRPEDSPHLTCNTFSLEEKEIKLFDLYQCGPLGGIMSAFEYDSRKAWLVLACDMPFIEAETLAFLVKNRNQDDLATVFCNPETKLPEPLVGIWEPALYSIIRHAFLQNQYSPTRILTNSKVNLLECPKPKWLLNVNTPEEYINWQQ